MLLPFLVLEWKFCMIEVAAQTNCNTVLTYVIHAILSQIIYCLCFAQSLTKVLILIAVVLHAVNN